MTSVEKRRSGRKSGGHRKHSDGGYSDTSSGGSFLDETDREVSTLTDRAFRSLCIGDEAVYNDSDLCSSSPCSQREKMLAFSQGVQNRDREDAEREELKRTAHESFTLRVQQYGQDWIHGGMYGAEIQRDPQGEVYGERIQGRVSATFQQSFVETSQQEKHLREEQQTFLSNGATEMRSQQRRSRSRVSSLIRAFNSEGHRDGAGMDVNLRERNNEASWDRSALMSIQRELSEFSTSYQQNLNSDHFPSAGPFSPRDNSFYSSEVAAVSHMKSASSFISSSHSKYSTSTQVNCNSNFFIHSEFSPFKIWRDHNRFPFQQGEVSGFMHCSEFPKWYKTPMYKEISLETQPQGPYRLDDRAVRHSKNKFASVGPATPSRSTSTSTMLQKAAAVEKRCESELIGHYPHRKRTQSLGTNRIPSSRPSTASPTIEMSRRVRDTISSVKALHQKIKMMTEQNVETANQQEELCSNDNLIPFGNNAVAPNVRRNTSTTPFSISQQLTSSVHAHQTTETSEVQQYAVSPQPVEHPPVRAESRGATPDVRMSSYKSRATSLLFNLKDNRKRVKNTYSPTKFKGLENLEKNKAPSIQERKETVIDIPDFPDQDIRFAHVDEFSRTNAAPHQYANPGLSLAALNSQHGTVHASQYSGYTLSDYQTAQMQGEVVHHSRFTDFMPENYTTNQVANGQNLHEDLLSFTPYKQGMIDNVETLREDVYSHNPSYRTTETLSLNADNNQTREYLISKANAEQHFNETVGREFTKEDRYQQLKDNKHDYSNVSSQDRWRQISSQGTEKLSLKTEISPWKQEITALIEKDQHAQAYQRPTTIKEELNISRDKCRGENQQSVNKELGKIELRESFGAGTPSHKNTGLVNPNISNQPPQYAPFSNNTVQNQAFYGQHQPGTIRDKFELQKYYGQTQENIMKENYVPQRYEYTDQEYNNPHTFYYNKDKNMSMQETAQQKQYTPAPKGHEIQSVHPVQDKPQFEHNVQKKPSNPDNTAVHTIANQVKDRQFVEVKAEQASAEHLTAQHAQAQLAKVQHWAQVEQPKAESTRLILAEQAASEKVKTELRESERAKHAKVEHIMEKRKEGELSREKQPEDERKEKTKLQQTRVQKETEEPRNITEEAGAVHMKEEQGEQVKAVQAKAERLKEEHIKTDLPKTRQAKIQQVVQARGERINVEHVEEEVRAQQTEIKQREVEQIRTEELEADLQKAEQTKEQQAKTGQEVRVVEMGKVRADHIKAGDITKVEAEEDSIQVGQMTAKPPTTNINGPNETMLEESKAKQLKLEQTKVELTKAILTKTETTLENFAKPATKLLPGIQQIKREKDKVEQVKTELAKAKAELAKIKEKMRGEQKEKIRNSINIKEDDITKKDVGLKVSKNEDCKVDTGTSDYKCLLEKYGLNSVSTNTNTGKDSSNDANETQAFSLDNVKAVTNKKSKDKNIPMSGFTTAKTENKEEVSILKSREMTERHYVYSESSKEFKLSSDNYLPSHVDNRENCKTATDKVKDDSLEKLEKCDSMKHIDVSQKINTNLTKLIPLERKSKSNEHGVGPGKEPHFIPPRALSHKERVQTKQEILTSKIKAHAEKEISAIKEKGFALRDGFISKHSTKQLSGIQSNNIQQKPISQEASKKHESTMSSNITTKQQMELSGTQTDVNLHHDHLQQQVPKDKLKSKGNVSEPSKGSYTTNTDEDFLENQRKENKSAIMSPSPSNKRALKNNQEANQEVPSVKPAIHTERLNKNKDDPSQATALVKAESDEAMATEKPENKNEAVHEDSAPSLHLALGQKKTPVVDDSLQIMGIMVTVRERQSSESNDQQDNSTHDQIITKEEKNSDSNKGESHQSSGQELGQVNKSSKEVSTAKATERAGVESHSTLIEAQTKVGVNNPPENIQETSTLKINNNMSENVAEKGNSLQESPSINAGPQREIQLQQPLTEKDVPSTVTVFTKNNVLAESQSPLYKPDTTAGETEESSAKNTGKDKTKGKTEEKMSQKQLTGQTNDIRGVETAGINCKSDSDRDDPKTLINDDVQQSVTEDISAVINSSRSRSIDGKSAPLLEEKSHGSIPRKQLSKTTPSHPVTENQDRHVSPKLKHKVAECNQVDDDVHTDSIAIRVVPTVTEKDNLKVAGKHNVTTVPSDEVVPIEHKQVASSSFEENMNTSYEGRTKDPTLEYGENQMKEKLEDKLQVEPLLSSVRKVSDPLKVSLQQYSINATANTKAGNGEPDNGKHDESRKSVDESMDGNYFQVQGVAEINDGDDLDMVSKGREFPAPLSNKAAVSNKPYQEVNNEVFVLDQGKMKTLSTNIQDQNMEKKNLETEDKLASKQCNNKIMEAGQDNHIKKHPTLSQSTLSPKEKQGSRNSHSSRENAERDKPELKPKPKERTSTIPEISAIADYARLKVIVSEDRANAIQEFPPNKKEGFFPLIHSRHSRRPVFTADIKDISVKEKSLPNKTEVSAKVHKEPKAPVFPITEKEHQRTGMFKLGDKERHDKMGLDATRVLDAGAKTAQHLKERNKSPTIHLKNQVSKEQVVGTDTQRLQVDSSIHQSDDPPLQTVHKSRNQSVSQHQEKPEDLPSKTEKVSYVNKNQKSQPTLELVHNIEVNRTTTNNEQLENSQAKIEEERKERSATQHEGTTAKQSEEERTSRIEEGKRAKDMKIKQIVEESRASIAKEQRRAIQREEERRAKEREAIAIKIKERREKQREAERKSEEERDRAAQKEEMREKQRAEERRVKETGEKITQIEEEWRETLRRGEAQTKENEERRRLKQQDEERAAIEEQQRRSALEEQRRRAAQEEQQRRAAHEEQQRRAAQEEQQRRAAQEEQQRRAALEEQRRRAAQEEQQRRAAQEEQQRRSAHEEQQRRAAQEEQQRRAAQEEQQRRAAIEEQRRRAAQEEQQRRAAQEEQQRKTAQEEQQRRAAQEEQQRRTAQEEQQRRAALEEQRRKTKHTEAKILAEIKEERRRMQREEEEEKAAEKEKTINQQREEKQDKEERMRPLDFEESQSTEKEDKERATHEQIIHQGDNDVRVEKRDDEEKFAAQREKENAKKMEEQRTVTQRVDALQYYAITSTESERKPKERQLFSPSPPQQRMSSSGPESTDESGSHSRLYRPRGSASPAPSLPRSNTSSPALGAKPSMFRVKDNTIRGSSFTKSVKPRFHKNFGEDFRVGSPMERLSEIGEEEQEMRRSDVGLNRLAAIKELSTFQPAHSSHDYSAHLPQHRPYSRRSLALDEDDSRSIISNMSEDVESFATSATDLADVRGLFDYDRPESACSFSSDVSRSLGKPPTVPPKSDKALRRAKRLTTRRIKKELCKVADRPVGVEKPLQEVRDSHLSSYTEVCSSNHRAVASPHFSSPISLARAPALGSSLPSSHADPQSPHSSVHASPHATGPISLAVASPHAPAPVSLPSAAPHAPGPASQTAAPKTVAHVPSSPTLHHASHQAPVTQYRVESSYPQSYPLTQRKVLQDLGSGQYFVVDVPVQVKTKTFFDPETGKYVQLNVRESSQSTSRPQPQQKHPQPQQQQQPVSRASPVGKPFVLYQGYHGYPQGYQPATINSTPPHSSSTPVSTYQDQQPVRGNQGYGYPAPDMRQSSEGHRYSPEKTPYMDTVNDTEKTYNTVYNTHGSYEVFPECDTNSQLAGSSVCENDNSAHSPYRSRDIITMSELEDFMEISDW